MFFLLCFFVFCFVLFFWLWWLVATGDAVVSPFILKGFGMGPLLVLVSPCFRENVIVTCKIDFFFLNFR